MLRAIIYTCITLGLEQDYMYHNSITKQPKPNMIYRLYKRFNREFRIEANTYVFANDLKKRSRVTNNWHINMYN